MFIRVTGLCAGDSAVCEVRTEAEETFDRLNIIIEQGGF